MPTATEHIHDEVRELIRRRGVDPITDAGDVAESAALQVHRIHHFGQQALDTGCLDPAAASQTRTLVAIGASQGSHVSIGRRRFRLERISSIV